MPHGTPFGRAGCPPASQQFGPGGISQWSRLQSPTKSRCMSKPLPQVRPGHSTQRQDGRCVTSSASLDTIIEELPARLLQLMLTSEQNASRSSEAHAERRSKKTLDAVRPGAPSTQLGGRNLSHLMGRARGRGSAAKATALPGGRTATGRTHTHGRSPASGEERNAALLAASPLVCVSFLEFGTLTFIKSWTHCPEKQEGHSPGSPGMKHWKRVKVPPPAKRGLAVNTVPPRDAGHCSPRRSPPL